MITCINVAVARRAYQVRTRAKIEIAIAAREAQSAHLPTRSCDTAATMARSCRSMSSRRRASALPASHSLIRSRSVTDQVARGFVRRWATVASPNDSHCAKTLCRSISIALACQLRKIEAATGTAARTAEIVSRNKPCNSTGGNSSKTILARIPLGKTSLELHIDSAHLRLGR